ncbi:MAG: SDR family oxidoreductase [Gammaproteobacteria bacterium]|nr:SDR family oxidoreductase [Gammaproteobacteria bacterium]
MTQQVAFITGASRGIGKQAAIALASEGFDVVLTARTLHDGEEHERGAFHSDTSAVTGSLTSTAKEIEALGQRALSIRLDLLDPNSVSRAYEQAIAEWGHIDLLLNNGIYQGPGTQSPVLDLTPQMLQNVYQANVFSQLLLVQLCLPPMLKRDSGCIINMVSKSGMIDPPAAANKGGWGFAYASSKAALIRMIGVLKAEHKESNVRLHNVEPGFVITENLREKGLVDDTAALYGGAPPTVPAAVIAWLATAPEASALHGETSSAQQLCIEHNLLPEWQPHQS